MAVNECVTESVFRIKGRWSLFLAKLHGFPINGSERVCDGACDGVCMFLALGYESFFLVNFQAFTLDETEKACHGDYFWL